MPEPDDTEGALDRLDTRLGAFHDSRRPKPVRTGIGGGAGEGYRLLGQLLGGVLGGLGLGWLIDHFAHTTPWGIVVGLFLGSGLSVFAAVKTASAIGARAEKRMSAGAPAVDDPED